MVLTAKPEKVKWPIGVGIAHAWPYRLVVIRILPFHGRDLGSTPSTATIYD